MTKSADFVTDFVGTILTCLDGLRLQLSWFVSAIFTEASGFHDLPPFLSMTFKICVCDLPRGEVLEKADVMEFVL